jgi:DNA-directed RNA polymerase specialized sigma24 family protein
MSDLKSINTAKLVNLCRADNKFAWTEFFRRYTNLIKSQIIKVFVSRQHLDLASNPDIVRDIYLLVFDKLYFQNALDDLQNSYAVGAWLKTIAISKTRDWLKTYHSQKNLPEKDAEQFSISLATPINRNGTLTVQDTLECEHHDNSIALKELGQVFRELDNLRKEELWALRLKVLFYDPLSDDEIRQLAAFIKTSYEQLANQLNKMMDRLLDKKLEKEADLKSAGRVWSLIRLLESRLREDLKAGDLSDNERKKLEDKLARKTKRIEKLRRSGNQYIEPPNEEIARILGIPQDNMQSISTLVHRARKKLKAKQSNSNFEE